MINPLEILRRRDMREVFTFTIDPADAKDFDDAISFERLAMSEEGSTNTYRIGVHIADVSFYVRPGTKIDDEAYERGTSVYLVDRVLPMLPEELCNDKCSLRPGEDKLCMSVVFTMDEHARVIKYKVCRTVIRSDERYTYDNVPDSEPIRVLKDLAAKMRAERIANGAMAIEQEEMRFRLDKQGHPTEIYFEEPNEAHHLIEEFMLLANRTIAKAVGSGRPFVYRVHDLPDSEKLDEVERFKARAKSRSKSGSRYAGTSREGLRRAIEMLTIRAQAKAVYSTYNIGHYGLAFSHYTHFTSPIRRYPDLMVHRLVERYILTGKKVEMNREEMELMCEHCSAREQEAAQAERESVKLFQAMWMSDHVGEVYDGYISGVMDYGLFVQLEENRCEGLVHASKIGDLERYALGDAVRVRVAGVDVSKSQIDFEFA